MEIYLIIFASLVVSVLSGVLTAGLILLVGGAGVIRSLHRRILLVEDRVEDTDSRITTEVKRRAAIAGVKARQEAPETPQELAKEHLSKQPDQAPPGGKPSVVQTLGLK